MGAEACAMDTEIEEQALADLCPEIRAILDAELDAGNHINRVHRTVQSFWPEPGSSVVYLEGEFFTTSSSLPAVVKSGGPDFQCGIGYFYQCELHDHVPMEALSYMKQV